VAIKTLLAGLSSVLKNRAPFPFVCNINVNVAVFCTRTKPINHTVSSEDVVETYVASSVHICVALTLGVGGLLLANVVYNNNICDRKKKEKKNLHT